MSDSTKRRMLGGSLIALGITVGAYAAVYFALVERETWTFFTPYSEATTVNPKYRGSGPVAEVVFWPMHQLDRHLLRRRYWSEPTAWQTPSPPASSAPATGGSTAGRADEPLLPYDARSE